MEEEKKDPNAEFELRKRQEKMAITAVAVQRLWRVLQDLTREVFLEAQNPMLDEFILNMEEDMKKYEELRLTIQPKDYAFNIDAFEKAIFRAKVMRDILRPNRKPTSIIQPWN